MKLVACPDCHAQYDVSTLAAEALTCRCGARVENRPQKGVDAEVHRCGSCGALARPEARECDYCGGALLRDERELSLLCPECFARNGEDGRFCTACGVPFAPEPPPEEAEAGADLPCPACEARMPPHRVGGVPVHECPRCRGLWAPAESFEHLVRRAIEAHREKEGDGVARGPGARLSGSAPRVRGGNPLSQRVAYRKCPECGGFMQRRNFQRRSGVIVDWCRSHGTWLDADELEAIAGYVASGGRLEGGRGPAAAATAGAASAGGREGDAREADAAVARLLAQRRSDPLRSEGGTLGSIARFLDVLLG